MRSARSAVEARVDPSAGAAWAVYWFGLAIQCWLWSRSSYAWDQIELSRIGVAYASGEVLSGYGKGMSGGGVIPGSLLQIVIGIPFKLWSHYRSPGLVVVISQAIAGVVLLRLFQRAAGARFAAIYLAVYWLGPWRLYHSGFMWEPNYLLLPAAAHLFATWSQRETARLGHSITLGLTLSLSPQLHISGFVLTGVTVILLLRRSIRLRALGVAIGATLGSLTLLPTAFALLRGELPALAPGAQPGLGFVKIFPLFKAVGYWLRLGSLDIGRRLRQVVFHPAADSGWEGAIGEVGMFTFELLTMATVLVALVASVQFIRRSGRGGGSGLGDDFDSTDARGFFRQYVLASLVALIVAAGLTSQTVQGWHTIVVLHAASIPPAVWFGRQIRRARMRSATALLAAYLLLRIPLALLLGFGHPMYMPPDEALPLDPERLNAIPDPRTRNPSFDSIRPPVWKEP